MLFEPIWMTSLSGFSFNSDVIIYCKLWCKSSVLAPLKYLTNTLVSDITQYASTNSDLRKSWISWKRSIFWTNYFHLFSFHVRGLCQDKDSNTALRRLAWLKRLACPKCCIDQTCCNEKWRRNPVSPPRFFLPKRSKKCHSSFALETGGFSPGDITSLLLLKSRHNTLSANYFI